MPFKANADRRHHIPAQQHRVKNWAEYDAGLRARGSLTVWFTAEAIEAWHATPRASRGGQPCYSDLAITTALTLRGVPPSLATDRGLDRLGPPAARPRSPRAGPLDPEPSGRGAGGAATEGGQRARAAAGGQHGAEALRSWRVAGREAWQQEASWLAQAASRRGRRHGSDRRGGVDRQGC